MARISFTTTSGWTDLDGFGCASLGLPGKCDNSVSERATWKADLDGIVLTGEYNALLDRIAAASAMYKIHAAIVVFGNAGGENQFIMQVQNLLSCPIVGGGAAIDPVTGKAALITGGGPAAVFLITDDRFSYCAVTECIHDEILEMCDVTFSDPRTALKINGVDARLYLAEQKARFGIAESDFEHLTLSDLRNVNAHLSMVDGVIKSGRDLQEKMVLRKVSHENVYSRMAAFYNDPDAIVFGCAGLSGLLDRPIDCPGLGLFLFGEVCTVDAGAEFGNLMLSKLVIKKK